MNGPNPVPTVRIVLDLNDLELAQFQRVIEDAPGAALNGGFLAKALIALAPHAEQIGAPPIPRARDANAHMQSFASILLRRQAE
jgi:hypothetical protein